MGKPEQKVFFKVLRGRAYHRNASEANKGGRCNKESITEPRHFKAVRRAGEGMTPKRWKEYIQMLDYYNEAELLRMIREITTEIDKRRESKSVGDNDERNHPEGF